MTEPLERVVPLDREIAFPVHFVLRASGSPEALEQVDNWEVRNAFEGLLFGLVASYMTDRDSLFVRGIGLPPGVRVTFSQTSDESLRQRDRRG